jgi:hypothetical protein
MVDRMRRRVIELQGGIIIRDEASGLYAQREQTTQEFSDMLGDAYYDDPRRF